MTSPIKFILRRLERWNCKTKHRRRGHWTQVLGFKRECLKCGRVWKRESSREYL